MDWISSLLLATVRLAIPVLLISLAELYGQRAGMVNIGLEGLASIGALVGFLVCYVTGSNWLGLLCGALAFGYTFFSAPARTSSRSSPCPRLPFRVSRTSL